MTRPRGRASLPWKMGVAAPTPRKPASSIGTGTITDLTLASGLSWNADKTADSFNVGGHERDGELLRAKPT